MGPAVCGSTGSFSINFLRRRSAPLAVFSGGRLMAMGQAAVGLLSSLAACAERRLPWPQNSHRRSRPGVAVSGLQLMESSDLKAESSGPQRPAARRTQLAGFVPRLR